MKETVTSRITIRRYNSLLLYVFIFKDYTFFQVASTQ